MLQADWNHPTQIRFGVGRAAELPDACMGLGMRQPLLVTDQTLGRLPISRELAAMNQARGIDTAVFARIASEPDGEDIAEGARVFLERGCDGIIAFGGGSSLDAGKAIALGVAVGPERIWEFAFRHEVPPPEIPKGRIPPIIAMPTTAGTGSEVNAAAVITDPTKRVKRSLFYPDLLARLVIADPGLTRGLPPFITAATGMDALSHNLEALCSPSFNPMLDAIAQQGLGYVKNWLPVAFRENRNIRARIYTMAASIMGAIAFEKGLGAMHAMAHAVGAHFKIHHGRTIGAVMPYVLRYNRKRISAKMAEAARFLDLPHHDTDAVVNWILELRRELGLPATLGELGVGLEHVPFLVDRTLADANAPTNPVPLDPEGVTRLYKWAIEGNM
jgi:hypothetical protein